MRRHVYFYTHIPQDYAAAAALLGGDPRAWLPDPGSAEGNGWRVRLRAEGALPARLAERDAVAVVGEPTSGDGRLLRSVAWQAASQEQLFPVLSADLGLDELEGTGCHLSLMGTYRPPLSVVGGAGDALLGHRVAESVVRSFVLDVADRISAALSTPLRAHNDVSARLAEDTV